MDSEAILFDPVNFALDIAILYIVAILVRACTKRMKIVVRWKEFFDLVKLPVVVLAVLNLIDCLTIASYTSSEGFKLDAVTSTIMAFSFLASIAILLYMGYAAAKFKFGLIGVALMSLAVNFIALLIGLSIMRLEYPNGMSLQPIGPMIHPLLAYTVFIGYSSLYSEPYFLIIILIPFLISIFGPIGAFLYTRKKQEKTK